MAATVTNIEADRDQLCQHQEAKVTAKTHPPNTPVTWKIDGEEVSSDLPDPNTIRVGGVVHPVGDGQRVKVEAKLDNTLSLDIQRVVSAIDVALEPPPPAIGPFGTPAYVITPEPAMPEIRAIARGIARDSIALNWHVQAGVDPTLVFEMCPRMPPTFIKAFDFSLASDGSSIDFGEAILGGGLAITVDGTAHGCPVSGGTSARLLGTNPHRSDVRDSFPNDTIRRIACRESGQRQFDAPADGGIGACPLFVRANRVGIMQLPNATDEQVWNWRANLDRGIAIFAERLEDARSYPNQVGQSSDFQDLVLQFNAIRQLQGKQALMISVPEFSSGDLDGNLQQLEKDAIRGYDGWFGPDGFGLELHEFRITVDTIAGTDMLRVTEIDEENLTGSAVWERVPPEDRPQSEGDPNYVESVLAFAEFCDASDPAPNPCGSKLRILDHQNHVISPASQALSVSNNVSSQRDLLKPEAFDDVSLDRDAFRLEIENPIPDHPVIFALTAGERLPVLYGPTASSGNRSRSQFLRIVSDAMDVTALGILNQQNVFGMLGDELVVAYEPGTGCADKLKIRVARPPGEQNNDHPVHLRHDIRNLHLRITVFSKPGTTVLAKAISDADQTIRLANVAGVQPTGYILINGSEAVHYAGVNLATGDLVGCTRGVETSVAAAHAVGESVIYSSTASAASSTEVEADLTTVDERFAQSGIRVARPVTIDLGAGSTGRILPPALLTGYEYSQITFEAPPGPQPTDSERAVIPLRTATPNVVDIFYVDYMFDTEDAIRAPKPGYSRIALINNSGDPGSQNFAVVSSSRKVLTVPHELMHILVNDGHRDAEPDTALLHVTRDDKAPDSTKRIGPYRDAETAGVGVSDTVTIRVSAEQLPD